MDRLVGGGRETGKASPRPREGRSRCESASPDFYHRLLAGEKDDTRRTQRREEGDDGLGALARAQEDAIVVADLTVTEELDNLRTQMCRKALHRPTHSKQFARNTMTRDECDTMDGFCARLFRSHFFNPMAGQMR